MQSLRSVTSEKEASDAAATWDTWGNSVNCPGHRPTVWPVLAGFDSPKLNSLVFPHRNKYLREPRNDQCPIQSHPDPIDTSSIYPKG